MSLDRHRPGYHFLPPANWMNDPNGLIYRQGEYHLFYQHNLHGAFHGKIHWGHAVSKDCVRWTHLPVALTPTPDSPDQDGCWSGCAVDNAGVPTIVYTGVRGSSHLPCLATSADGLLTWQKRKSNPIIAAPPAGLELLGFRDHSVWNEAGTWYQIIGSGIKDVGGTALLYRSPDLINWEYLHPLCVGDKDSHDPIWTGTLWECPEFFRLGDKFVLSISVWDKYPVYSAYFVGDYANHKFTPRYVDRLDIGMSFYAPQSLVDDRGRRIMWGWLREEREADEQLAAGWSGAMSLPRVLSMLPDGRLGMRPVPELATLRGKRFHLQNAEMSQAKALLQRIQGDMLEIRAEIEQGRAEEVSIGVRCAPDRSEQTHIRYDRQAQRLSVDGRQSSLSDAVTRAEHGGPLALKPGEPLALTIFLDRSIVEVFANDRACITSRIYPTQAGSLGLDIFERGGKAELKSLDVWEMTPIWT